MGDLLAGIVIIGLLLIVEVPKIIWKNIKKLMLWD